jgi:hypothetical protein
MRREFEWQNPRLLTGIVRVQVPRGAPIGSRVRVAECAPFKRGGMGSSPVRPTRVMRCRSMAGHWRLKPAIVVRVHAPQSPSCYNDGHFNDSRLTTYRAVISIATQLICLATVVAQSHSYN